jgi:hypothetical protein
MTFPLIKGSDAILMPFGGKKVALAVKLAVRNHLATLGQNPSELRCMASRGILDWIQERTLPIWQPFYPRLINRLIRGSF